MDLSLTGSVFCRPQKTLAHLGDDGRNCLTGSYFTAKMPFVPMRMMPPKSPPQRITAAQGRRKETALVQKTSLRLLAIGISLPLLVSGCGRQSASQVVTAAYLAANEGNYSKAQSYLSSSVLGIMQNEPGVSDGDNMGGAWDKVTRNRTINRIEVLKEDIRRESADVQFRIHFNDGTTEDDRVPLILEKDAWKIR